jgi:pimeloyl-ACP methyl ester carboxylesterase
MQRTNVLSLDRPTIVLVHGALTDASVWSDVMLRLQGEGHTVCAPALPMRSLAGDAEYLAALLERIVGDVVLVGHSYAGAVISHPAVADTGVVKALIFIAAFQPDEGEAAGDLNEMFPGSELTPETLEVAPNPLGGDDLTLRPDRFAHVYAADLERGHAAVLASSQRPIDPAALGEPLPGQPGWRTIRSWALVSTADRSLPPAILRFMAERASSDTVEVDAAHAVPLSQPGAVSALIAKAARTTSTRSRLITDDSNSLEAHQ